jgi:microcin C transport system substrate-binding protein
MRPRAASCDGAANPRRTTFDKFNPFTLKGTAPAYLGNLMFETLLTGSRSDETATGYGLLAEDVDGRARPHGGHFRLDPEARFHNGDPVLAADVKHSFDTLMAKDARRSYKHAAADVKGNAMWSTSARCASTSRSPTANCR